MRPTARWLSGRGRRGCQGPATPPPASSGRGTLLHRSKRLPPPLGRSSPDGVVLPVSLLYNARLPVLPGRAHMPTKISVLLTLLLCRPCIAAEPVLRTASTHPLG